MKLDPAYQACAAMFIGAHLVASLIVGANVRYFVVSSLTYGLLFFLYKGVLKLLEKNPGSRKFQKQLLAWEEEVFALTNAEARTGALEVLLDKKTFRIAEDSNTDLPPHLSPSLREFFSKYDQVRAVCGGFELSRKMIKPHRNRFIQIGVDDDFVELVVRPHHDSVYELESDGTYICDYPSIYHLILLRNRLYN